MITYKLSSDVADNQIFEAFTQGFSDYFFPLTMKEEEFITHFFGPEGNEKEYSFIAFDEEKPIGIILGGIRIFDGLKTMRCGTLGLGPNYRGTGISKHLFELQKEVARKEGCQQLFLEVIRENYRAIAFYQKLGYAESTILKYYSEQIEILPPLEVHPPYQIEKINYEMIKGLRDSLICCHINWQNDTPYYENNTEDLYLAAYDEYRTIGMLAITPRGKINFLWVEPDYRMQGVGHLLISEASKQLLCEKISVCIPGNASLEGFFRKLGFHKEKIEQYEMYLSLSSN